jgi:rod shape-determining protein MreD
MQWIRFAVLICFGAVLQAGFLSNLNIKIDVLLVLLVFFAVYSNTSEAIVSSFTIGLAADLIGWTMGPHIISFGIFGTALAYLHRVIAIRKMPYQAIAIFLMAWLTGLLVHLLNNLKGQPGTDIYTNLLKVSVFSGIAGPFLFLPVAWWMQIKTNRFRRNRPLR